MPDPVHHDDVGELLVDIAKGKQAAFEDIYRLTSTRLYGVCLRIVVRHNDAEDVLQQVYGSLWRGTLSFDAAGTDGLCWLTMTTRKMAIDRLHAGGYSRHLVPFELASGIADKAPVSQQTQETHSLIDCLEELEPRNRDLLRIAFFEALTYQELAGRNGVPLGTVKNWMQHSLVKLEADLGHTTPADVAGSQDGYRHAGEYVLGVLDEASRRWVEKRIAADSAFANSVNMWEGYLFPLALQVPSHAVPGYVWARISSELGLGTGEVVIPSVTIASGNDEHLHKRLALWRWLTAGGFATATICASMLLLYRDRPPRLGVPQSATPIVMVDTTPMGATLVQSDGKPSFVATMDAHSGRMTVTPLQSPATDGRVLELWLVPAKGKPHSLGVVDTLHAQAGSIPETMLPLLNKGAALLVTLEPPGGAPAGEATGPVIAKGELTML